MFVCVLVFSTYRTRLECRLLVLWKIQCAALCFRYISRDLRYPFSFQRTQCVFVFEDRLSTCVIDRSFSKIVSAGKSCVFFCPRSFEIKLH